MVFMVQLLTTSFYKPSLSNISINGPTIHIPFHNIQNNLDDNSDSGCNIQKLREDFSDANIQIPDSPGPERVMRISADELSTICKVDANIFQYLFLTQFFMNKTIILHKAPFSSVIKYLDKGRVQKKKKKSGIFQIQWVGGSEKVHFPDLKK